MFDKKKKEESEVETTTETPELETISESVTETVESPTTTKEVLNKCKNGASPDGKHNMFHNEGTDETYCIYCGLS